MPKISTRVTFDKVAAALKIKAMNNLALTDMGTQALADTQQYVPDDQHILKNSGITHSDRQAADGVFRMRWSTPYAQYLWHGEVMHGNAMSRTYGPEKLNFTSAMACEEWARYAHKVHGKEWKEVYQAALKRRMRNDATG